VNGPKRLVPAREPTLQPLTDAEIVEAEVAQVSERTSRRVAKDLHGREEIAAHAEQLGKDVDSIEGKMEAHLHDVFDHRLGRLRESTTLEETTSVVKASNTGLASLMKSLTSPESIRDAFIMAEIFRRPEDRW
jgi:hypothetical protein